MERFRGVGAGQGRRVRAYHEDEGHRPKLKLNVHEVSPLSWVSFGFCSVSVSVSVEVGLCEGSQDRLDGTRSQGLGAVDYKRQMVVTRAGVNLKTAVDVTTTATMTLTLAVAVAVAAAVAGQ